MIIALTYFPSTIYRSCPRSVPALSSSAKTGLVRTSPTPNALAFTGLLRPPFASISVRSHSSVVAAPAHFPPQLERKPHLTSGLPTHEVQQSIDYSFHWDQNLGFSASTTLLAASPKATPLPRVERIKTPLLLLSSVAHLGLSLHGVYSPPCSSQFWTLFLANPRNRSFTTYLSFQVTPATPSIASTYEHAFDCSYIAQHKCDYWLDV